LRRDTVVRWRGSVRERARGLGSKLRGTTRALVMAASCWACFVETDDENVARA
jgi:hypothetical protein